ncbi:hypothetical protein HMPREF3201_02357 [Megasphaera sp. MJR8396C]|nr:hypothetical protein HMPREF3201_02357 [Megasphaera sp. MJR8396C]
MPSIEQAIRSAGNLSDKETGDSETVIVIIVKEGLRICGAPFLVAKRRNIYVIMKLSITQRGEIP